MNQPRKPIIPDGMNGSLLGPEYTDKEISLAINKYNAEAVFFSDFDILCTRVAFLLDAGNVIGWFQGRMEFGPRALGNRSILGDARNPEMQRKLNVKIKYREGFRPFAPAVLKEDMGEYFDLVKPSPYMLLVAPVKTSRRKSDLPGLGGESLMQKLYQVRSDIPAVTHIDYSARIQSVDSGVNQCFYQLIQKFKVLTNYGIVINTSFNVRGEPIVCTPDDAYRCFMSTEMDYLVIGNYLFSKQAQPANMEFTKGAKGDD
jgi:carbamoyltransferase